eukprot:2443365-Pyramimonas_sp.AAC.1
MIVQVLLCYSRRFLGIPGPLLLPLLPPSTLHLSSSEAGSASAGAHAACPRPPVPSRSGPATEQRFVPGQGRGIQASLARAWPLQWPQTRSETETE